jgi:UDP-N-acetylglucosamine 2-epimerase (non-hydrolysing)
MGKNTRNMLIDLIAGARPNFMKIAPIIKSINTKIKEGIPINFRLIHTGQHFDKNMSDTFFKQLGIPEPHFNLEAGGGTPAEQTSKIMIGYEKLLVDSPSDICLVVGDVTSTMACSIVAKKNNIKVAHVEGGIRSGDMTMPEEINRLVTDSISDYFFTTSTYANKNLLKSGINKNNIFFVGNTMIDSLLEYQDKFEKPQCWDINQLSKENYIVITLHRPSNVDNQINLQKLLNTIIKLSKNTKLIFPVHPRTKKIIDNLIFDNEKLIITDPLPYLEFNYLVKNSKLVITDSGGITEETTVLGIPCMTLRDNTERPETVTIGTNVLVGSNSIEISKHLGLLFENKWKIGGIPPLWDGNASKRIVEHLIHDIFEI